MGGEPPSRTKRADGSSRLISHRRKSPSPAAVASQRPFGLNAKARLPPSTNSYCAHAGLLVAKCHNHTCPSSLAVANQSLVGLMAICWMGLLWLSSNNGEAISPCSALSKSQIRTVWSVLPVTMRWPPSAKATSTTWSSWPRNTYASSSKFSKS